MIFTTVLANIAGILALSTSLVNPMQTLAANAQVLANDSQNTVVEVTTPTPEVKDADRVVDAVITAYTSTPGQTDDSPFIAANGKRVHDGMIAVNGLPFGTIIKIPELFGEKEFVVEDRMNKRYSCKDNHCNMDIWMDTTVHEARVFGLHHVKAEIYLPDTELASK